MLEKIIGEGFSVYEMTFTGYLAGQTFSAESSGHIDRCFAKQYHEHEL